MSHSDKGQGKGPAWAGSRARPGRPRGSRRPPVRAVKSVAAVITGRSWARILTAAGAAVVAAAAAAVSAPSVSAQQLPELDGVAMTVADGNSVIAVRTSGDGLRFYWNEHGTNTWHGEQVAADGTTFSAPSIAQVGDVVVIAVQGPGGSLDLYSQRNGATGWTPQVVAGPNTTNDAPSVTADGSSVIIAAEGAFNSLDFYWAASVGSAWHQEQVAGPATTYSAPSQTMNGDSVNIAAEGPGGSLDFYWAANGSSTWTREVVVGPGAIASGSEAIPSGPVITANAGSVNVAAVLTGSASSLGFYWAVNGITAWNEEILPGPAFGFYGTPAITTVPDGVHVVANGGFGVLSDDATFNETGTWQLTALTTGSFLHGSPYVGPSSPAVTVNDGIENIANVGSNGNLYFWWLDRPGHYIGELVDTSANL